MRWAGLRRMRIGRRAQAGRPYRESRGAEPRGCPLWSVRRERQSTGHVAPNRCWSPDIAQRLFGFAEIVRYAVRYDRDGVVTRAARCDQSFDLLKHMITMVVCLPTAEPGQQRRAEIAAFLQKNSTVREPA